MREHTLGAMMGLSESRDMRGMLDMEFGMSTPQAMGNQKVLLSPQLSNVRLNTLFEVEIVLRNGC